ncbi:MAG: 30S ribosomal protein S17 [Sumerlaeia bacterium]
MAEQAEVQQETAKKSRISKSFIGVVGSNKMDKTIVVQVQRLTKHPVYKKYIRRNKKLYAHDANNEANIGDRVEVVEVSRPLSKLKRYRLRRIIERAK